MRPLCRSCRAEITWVITEGGRFMPLDPHPDPSGNVELVSMDRGEVRARVHPGIGSSDGGTRYRPHWATCPDAKQHRR